MQYSPLLKLNDLQNKSFELSIFIIITYSNKENLSYIYNWNSYSIKNLQNVFSPELGTYD